jgi:type II secretory pathway pseudopilin PulG
MKKRAFTLIEILIGLFLFLVIFIGVFTAYRLILKVSAQSRNRITAAAIANGEIEKIRNLSYSSVGTVGGFPEGILESSKTLNFNDIDYLVEIRVDYVIDEIDGISFPEDDCPNDYKKVEIEVSWLGMLGDNVRITTDISSSSLAEECSETGGVLFIQVFDAYGGMIISPFIEIKNPETNENIKTAIPDDGKHFFSLPIGQYKVVVSKSGYNVNRTYGIEEIANPEKPHLSVLEGILTQNSFSIDELGSFNVETTGPASLGYPLIPNVNFKLQGEKILGTDLEEDPVYNYSEDHFVGGTAQKSIFNLEWDNYSFSSTTSGLELSKIESPFDVEVEQPISLNPGASTSVRLVLQAANSLLLIIKDDITLEPIFSAQVRLYNIGYDATFYTDQDGKIYFIPLGAGNYNLEITVSGYTYYADSVYVSGDISETINLERIE